MRADRETKRGPAGNAVRRALRRVSRRSVTGESSGDPNSGRPVERIVNVTGADPGSGMDVGRR
jgi:hypothetical protein